MYNKHNRLIETYIFSKFITIVPFILSTKMVKYPKKSQTCRIWLFKQNDERLVFSSPVLPCYCSVIKHNLHHNVFDSFV